MSTFIEALDAHLVNEYSASQQYIAIAVWYDDQTAADAGAGTSTARRSRSGTTP